jgi:transcription-repair coupling factor (superfamily II helicase)
MLEDAVADMRAEKGRKRSEDHDWTPNIGLGLPVLIPEGYVHDLPVRLGLYRRIGALASDAETEAMAAELVDRFGPLPEEVENLLQVVTLKRMCREAGVEKLDSGPKGMVLSFRGNAFRNPSGLVSWLSSKNGLIRLRPDHKLAIAREMTVAERLRMARDVVGNLNRIALQAKAA